ncbi:hypothetical protein ACFQJD_15045 [Haloplanus sp. GCM10025708]|uniref:hypothetical protein n=1 Tax=Haloferacaceae TaxID=1644056 RepID=UPI00361F2E08
MDASELEYELFRNKQAWKICFYFSILPIIHFVLLHTVGKEPVLIAGWPLLLWEIVAVALAYVVGLYILIRLPEKRKFDETDQEVSE